MADFDYGLNTPQFMGQQVKKNSIEDIRTLTKKQRRTKGFRFNAPTGDSTNDITLSGTARILLGINLIGTNNQSFLDIISFQFKVNNEIVIDQTDPNFFLKTSLNSEEYYSIPRALSGTDQITITFKNSGATEIANLQIWYI